MSRSDQFYVEFVILTVFSLTAANLWIRLITRILNQYADSVLVDFIIASAITILSIIILRHFFSDNKEREIKILAK